MNCPTCHATMTRADGGACSKCAGRCGCRFDIADPNAQRFCPTHISELLPRTFELPSRSMVAEMRKAALSERTRGRARATSQQATTVRVEQRKRAKAKQKSPKP